MKRNIRVIIGIRVIRVIKFNKIIRFLVVITIIRVIRDWGYTKNYEEFFGFLGLYLFEFLGL